jgi:hypothetical protein
MDFEDIVCAVAFGVCIILRILSDKRKQTLKSDQKSEPSCHPDVGKVRKQPIKTIGKLSKTTRRPCNTKPQTSPSHKSRPDTPLSPVKRNFSAYKHLPEQTTTEGNIPDVAVLLTEPTAPFVSVSASPVQRDVAGKKTRLREWVTGQVILDTPAFRKNYGNFFNR